MTITILYFAASRTSHPLLLATESIPLPTVPTPFHLAELRAHLVALYTNTAAAIATWQTVLEQSEWSVNEEMIDRDQEAQITLKDGDVVGVIPAVSGG